MLVFLSISHLRFDALLPLAEHLHVFSQLPHDLNCVVRYFQLAFSSRLVVVHLLQVIFLVLFQPNRLQTIQVAIFKYSCG